MTLARVEVGRSIKSVMENKALFKKIKELDLPIGEYALFGSAPMGIRGLRDCRDIDMIVSEKLWDDLVSKGWKKETVASGSERLLKDEIEVFKEWRPKGLDVDKLISEADIVDDLPFVKLKYVLTWKKLNGRDKDKRDIEILEKFNREENN